MLHNVLVLHLSTTPLLDFCVSFCLSMAKSKKQSLSRRPGGEDFALQPSARASLRTSRVPLRSLSPVQSDSESSTQGLPPQPKLTFGEFASTPLGVRVSMNSCLQSSSSSSCARKGTSNKGSQEASLTYSVGSRALQSNRLHPSPSDQAPRGIAPSDQAGQLTIQQEVPGSPKFPRLVHFPVFTSTATYNFLASDVSPQDDSLKFCLIGFVAGKCPGYILLSQFIVQNWNSHATLIMHDSGWLIFEFLSESVMLDTLSRRSYSVFGRPLILQVMPDFFDFSPPDLTKMPVWV